MRGSRESVNGVLTSRCGSTRSSGGGCCNIEAAAWLEDGEAKRLVSLAVNPSLFFVTKYL